MAWRFRRTKRFGPLSVTLTHRGISTSIGAGGLRYQLSGPGKRRARRTTSNAPPAAASHAGSSAVAVLLLLLGGAFVAGRMSGSNDATSDANSNIAASDEAMVPEPQSNSVPLTDALQEPPITETSSARPVAEIREVDAVAKQHIHKPPVEPIRIAAITPVRPKPPAKMRVWTDKSGKFRTLARLTDIEGDTIYLQKENGDVRPVPLARLCLADQTFVRTKYPIQQLFGEVVGISDGDTLTLLDENKTQHKIRLDGIDAPESHQDFGTQSRKALAKKVIRQQVRAEWFDKDRYGRILADIYLNDRWINREMLEDGLAWHFKRYNNSALLAAAEVKAREAVLGLWSQPNPVEPWNFRRTPQQPRGPPGGVATLVDYADHADHEHDQIVYITDSGTRYHREGCKYLKSSTPVALSEVQGIYTPCKVCHPELVRSRPEPEKTVRTKRPRPS